MADSEGRYSDGLRGRQLPNGVRFVVIAYRAMQLTLVSFAVKIGAWTSIQRRLLNFGNCLRPKISAGITLPSDAGLMGLCVHAAIRRKRGSCNVEFIGASIAITRLR